MALARTAVRALALTIALPTLATGCSSPSDATRGDDGGATLEAGAPTRGASDDGGSADAGGPAPSGYDAGFDPSLADASALVAPTGKRVVDDVAYASAVVSWSIGDNGGYGLDHMPNIVLGPPNGGGACAGSLDVLSLGVGGEVVVALAEDLADGPGPDLMVFENPFWVGCDSADVFAELGEVAVSENGHDWYAWPCTPSNPPYDANCSGWKPVLANKTTPIDPAHLDQSGGESFDLAAIGVTRARYVRIRDLRHSQPTPPHTGKAGYDLDAIAALHVWR